jgi:molecular chaperone GrpE
LRFLEGDAGEKGERLPKEPETQSIEPDLEKQIEQLTEERDREHDLFLRTLADFQNYRRRTEREQSKADRKAKRDILLSLLEVLDGFERAFRQVTDQLGSEDRGLHELYRQLSNVVASQGVHAFDSLGCSFDPTVHEAIATLPSDGQPSGLIVEEHRRGYRWEDELLRPARVTVLQ